MGPVLPELLGTYVLASVAAFFMYGMDKRAAVRGTWRTPESTLHVLSLLGGWPGALIAQQVFRHKTAKRSFRAVFWLTVAANCLFLGWFVLGGAAGLASLIGIGRN